MLNEKYLLVDKIIKSSKSLVVFTGAGMSVESGIPAFTGNGGLWTKYDPKFIELDYFFSHPSDSWKQVKHIFYDHMINKAKPNFGHISIANLEKKGIVKTVITQNIDGLHQLAGSKEVYELHGTTKILKCIKCGGIYKDTEINLKTTDTPTCNKCGGILKPNFVFYGENLDSYTLNSSIEIIKKADVILIIGTSGQVMPANQLPFIAKNANPDVKIIEINPNKSTFTNSITNYYFQESVVNFFRKITN